MNTEFQNAPKVPARFLVPVPQLYGEDEEETQLLRSMATQAESYLSGFDWCRSIKAKYFGAGVGQVVAIFLFNIVPRQAAVDDWLWVVVGDIPPAYLVVDQAKTPSTALVAYVDEMRRWIQLAKRGQTSSEVIRVNMPATAEWAQKLEKRMNFLEENILPRFREREIQRA